MARHGIIFLQFSLYLKSAAPLAYAALAEAYESSKKYDLEMQALDQIKPDSPLWPNAQIQNAFALNSMERVDDARALLEDLAAKDPKDVRPLDALGNILRAHERYGEARDYYTRALKLIPKPSKDNWTLFCSRDVCNERMKTGRPPRPISEALALSPEESLVLNYLGFPADQPNSNRRWTTSAKCEACRRWLWCGQPGLAYYRLGNLPAAVENPSVPSNQPDDRSSTIISAMPIEGRPHAEANIKTRRYASRKTIRSSR